MFVRDRSQIRIISIPHVDEQLYLYLEQRQPLLQITLLPRRLLVKQALLHFEQLLKFVFRQINLEIKKNNSLKCRNENNFEYK